MMDLTKFASEYELNIHSVMIQLLLMVPCWAIVLCLCAVFIWCSDKLLWAVVSYLVGLGVTSWTLSRSLWLIDS
jgi:hypothetical protein